MDDIASELGMSKKTLYQIVSDKNELVDQVIFSDFRYFKDKLDAILKEPEDAIFQLIKINGLLYEFLTEFSQTVNYDLQKYHSQLYDKIQKDYENLFLPCLRDNLIKGKQEKIYRIKLNEEIISKLHLSRIEQVFISEIFRPEEFKSYDFVKAICLYHLYGIINEQGRNLLEKYNNEIENINKQVAR